MNDDRFRFLRLDLQRIRHDQQVREVQREEREQRSDEVVQRGCRLRAMTRLNLWAFR